MTQKLKQNRWFILFFLSLLILNILLVPILNYDSVVKIDWYNKQVEANQEPDLDYALMLDNKLKVDNYNTYRNDSMKLLIIPSIIFCILFMFLNFDKIKKEYIFLIVWIPIALLYVFIMPIGGIPDENAHWLRSYEISLGKLIAQKDENGIGGDILPSNVPSVLSKEVRTDGMVDPTEDSYVDWKARYAEGKNKEGEEFTKFPNTSIYPAVCYFPQAIGIVVTRLFTKSLMAQAYGARLANLALYSFIMWYAIRKIPFKKVAMILIAFLPIALQESVSMSIDGTLTAFITLIISYTLYLTYDKSKEKLDIKDYIILITSSIFTAITKIVYLPIVLFLFLIPKEKFGSMKKKYLIITLIFVLATVLDFGCVLFSLGYKNTIAAKDASMIGQLKHILLHPTLFLMTILSTIRVEGMQHILQMFGQSLSWNDIDISPIYVMSLLLITVYYIFAENREKENINIHTKILGGLIAFVTVLAIIVTEYLTITAVGSFYIIGIMGRYYIPILILLCLAFSNNYIIRKNKDIPIKYLLSFLILANLHTLTCFVYKYL